MKNIFSLFSSWLIWSINLWSFISPCFRLCWSFHATEVSLIWAEFSFFLRSNVKNVLLSLSFTPKQLGWFPRREGGHNDSTVCRRWSNSRKQRGALNWRLWVASGSFLYNFTIYNLKSPSSGPKLLLIKKGKEMFEVEDLSPFHHAHLSKRVYAFWRVP